MPDGRITYAHIPTKKRRMQRQRTSLHEQIQKIALSLKTTAWWEETKSTLNEISCPEVVKTIRSIGLGSFQESGNSRHQLACASLLADKYVNATVFVCDPIMVEDDLEVLNRFGYSVESDATNKEAEDSGMNLLFMPHCGRELYEAVLRTYINRGSLERVILLGNRLSGYLECTEVQRSTIINSLFAANAISEHTLPPATKSTRETAFNDMCITTFAQPQLTN